MKLENLRNPVVMSLVLFSLIVVITASSAMAQQYVCEPVPINLYPTLNAQYPYDQNIEISVRTEGLQDGYTVTGQIKDETNAFVQQLSGQVRSNLVVFRFSPIKLAGTFKFQALATRPTPPYDTISSAIKLFSIKAPLTLDFTNIGGAVAYTTSNLELRATILTPSGGVIETIKVLTAKLDGFPLSIDPQYIDEGSGRVRIIIPKEKLGAGRMDITLSVSDFQNRYEPVTKTIAGISVVKPTVSVSIQAPTSARVGETITIRVSAQDINGNPFDPDFLKIISTFPSGIGSKTWEKSAIRNDFTQQTVGTYTVQFQIPEEGGSYRFRAEAIEDDYNKGASNDILVVVSGGGGAVSCNISSQCDAGCENSDPDCKEAGFPYEIVIGLIILAGIVYYLTRKKKGKRK